MCAQFYALLKNGYVINSVTKVQTSFKNDFFFFLCCSLDAKHEDILFRILRMRGDERKGEVKEGEEGKG